MHNALHHPDPAARASTAAPDAGLQHGSHGRHSHHTHSAGPVSGTRLTTEATLHCLVGCAIGEFVGLAIGVSLGLNPWITMALATVLGFASG